MKRFLLAVCGLALAAGAASSEARAQGGTVAKGPNAETVKDMEAEKSARHELEVARTYFKNRKAYFSSLKRADELVAGYPEFSRIDEALYMAGMSAVYLIEGKGKQKLGSLPANTAKEHTPETLRELARMHLSRLVKDFPESDYRKEAERALAGLGAAAKQGEAKQQ
ncbi:MAG TPA: tetratricopeptide repeat protein [Pyrinomonadaceae bacterium]|nr:tetratricopeptide repeat protein [Pyrinomonadaceae bacterium]